jgi:asparagine synthase (glutamine-hydrolysing)
MCGIAGIVASDRLHADERVRIADMRDVLAHRGPDEAGTHLDEYAALGHRRLSIVDLASGQQPLANEDQTVWIVFNGEIYNHADVRRELIAAGHVYRTRSDTETIVHAYEEWGDACVEHFRGMFAFAIWDAALRRLLLARDRLGIKPLYWSVRDGRLIFASEIKAILASGLVQAEPNEAALPEMLSTRHLAGEETLFSGIFKLLPGHTLVFDGGQTKTRRYWDVPVGMPEAPGSDRDRIDRFRELLTESIRLRLMSDVPLGMFLSGGIDSSAIAALMARMIDRPLQTFSVAFKDRAFSELEYAREVARAIHADGHEIVIDEHDFFDALPRLVWHEDEPIAHTSSVPLYFVSRLARDHVTVVLTGEGSDELLAGYGRYPRALANWRIGAAYESVVPQWLRRQIADRAVPSLPAAARRYADRSFLTRATTPEALFLDNFAAINLAQQRDLLAGEIAGSVTENNAYRASAAYFHAVPPGTTLLERLLYSDIKTYLVELLMKQDQMSMAASIESRVPFLDHKLVEYAATLPARLKLRGFSTKRVLREAMKGVLPESILTRPKMGFPVPFAEWMRGPSSALARDVLLDRRSRERGIINPSRVQRMIDAHAAGRVRAGDRIWTLLNLELWYRTFIDGQGVQTLPRIPADTAPTPVEQARALARTA